MKLQNIVQGNGLQSQEGKCVNGTVGINRGQKIRLIRDRNMDEAEKERASKFKGKIQFYGEQNFLYKKTKWKMIQIREMLFEKEDAVTFEMRD